MVLEMVEGGFELLGTGMVSLRLGFALVWFGFVTRFFSSFGVTCCCVRCGCLALVLPACIDATRGILQGISWGSEISNRWCRICWFPAGIFALFCLVF